MKKHGEISSLTIGVIALCVMLLSIVVSAHSGRTDSNGGHYNHSTGEYHYHHGYSAHQHYDMNGDGKKDCPYEFDDKTNTGSNSSINSSNKTDNSTSISENKTENSKNKITFGKVIKSVLYSIPLSMVTLYALYIVLALIGIIVVWFVEKCFKVSIDDSIQQRILHALLIIGLIIIVPIEILFLLEIL
jgi:hypothetical protein